MAFSFESLTYRPKPIAVLVEAVLPALLAPETVIGLWQERSAIQQTDNTELIRWHHDNERSEAELRRACELCAAADMSVQYGRYVEPIIRPHIMNERD